MKPENVLIRRKSDGAEFSALLIDESADGITAIININGIDREWYFHPDAFEVVR